MWNFMLVNLTALSGCSMHGRVEDMSTLGCMIHGSNGTTVASIAVTTRVSPFDEYCFGCGSSEFILPSCLPIRKANKSP
ncbi:hypothetical protein BKA64DRAFT_372175 [Cadophora sp. MPI-SDFR-AT-0126]|nr:hypothetical protein BKA64DRAFT_372175 [Leotiomycetes sp. MPI-SDFR-AT-0126]